MCHTAISNAALDPFRVPKHGPKHHPKYRLSQPVKLSPKAI